MSKGKRFSALATATVVALSMAGYFPATKAYATNASCAENPVTLRSSNLSRLATNGKYKLMGDTTGDLSLSGSVWSSPSVEIDLNGCTLNGRITVSEGATVTVIDSSAEGTGEVTGGRHNDAASSLGSLFPSFNGNLVIKGGNFTKTITSDGNVSISGGTFIASDKRFVSRHLANGYTAFEMSDGRIIVEKPVSENDITATDIELNELETAKASDYLTVNSTSKGIKVEFAKSDTTVYGLDEDEVSALTAGEADLNYAVSQYDGTAIEGTIKVTVNPTLLWVSLDGQSEKTDLGEIEAGQTLQLEPITNHSDMADFAPEFAYETTGAAEFDENLDVISVDENGLLTAENIGIAEVRVTATYGGKTATGYGYIRVLPTEHEVIVGNGAEYDGTNLTQEIDGEMRKYRFATIYRESEVADFYAEHGEDKTAWDEETKHEFFELLREIRTEIDPENYSVAEGSTVITFASEWLDTLEPDTYNVQYAYTDGFAEAQFVIAEPTEEPVVPDEPVIPEEPIAPEQPVTPEEPIAPEQPVTPENEVEVITKKASKAQVKEVANTGTMQKETNTVPSSIVTLMAAMVMFVILSTKRMTRRK